MYQPKPPPINPDVAALAQYTGEELQALAQSQLDTVDYVHLNVLYAAPARPRAGLMVEADGTSWNPGAGAGTYIYRAGAWVKLG